MRIAVRRRAGGRLRAAGRRRRPLRGGGPPAGRRDRARPDRRRRAAAAGGRAGHLARGRGRDAARGAGRPAAAGTGGDPARPRRRQLRPGVRAGAARSCPGSRVRRARLRRPARARRVPRRAWPGTAARLAAERASRARPRPAAGTIDSVRRRATGPRTGGASTGGTTSRSPPPPSPCGSPRRRSKCRPSSPSCSCSRRSRPPGRPTRWPSHRAVLAAIGDGDGALARAAHRGPASRRSTLDMIERHLALQPPDTAPVAGRGRRGSSTRPRRSRPVGGAGRAGLRRGDAAARPGARAGRGPRPGRGRRRRRPQRRVRDAAGRTPRHRGRDGHDRRARACLGHDRRRVLWWQDPGGSRAPDGAAGGPEPAQPRLLRLRRRRLVQRAAALRRTGTSTDRTWTRTAPTGTC